MPGDGTVIHDSSYNLMNMNRRKIHSFTTHKASNALQEVLD